MDDKTLSIILSMSIAIPSLLAMGRISNIQEKYYPFVICLWLGFAAELVVAFFFQHRSTNTVYNLYVLAEFPLYCWLFYNWQPGKNNRLVSFFLAGIAIVVWLVETFEFRTIYRISSYYRIFYSFALVLLAINRINWLLVNEKKLVLYNASFLICSGIIIFFSYKILIEVFYLYAPEPAAREIFKINPYLNTFQNLIFALAVLCIPGRIYSSTMRS